MRLFVWLAIGLIIYFTYSSRHSKVQSAISDDIAGSPARSMAD
jgi:hypothetical protein